MTILITIFKVLAAIFTATLLHECGHILVGLLHHFKFDMLVVGPIGLKRIDNKIRFYFEKNYRFWGGIASTVPTTSDDKHNSKVFRRILLGGPISSLLFGFIFFMIYIISKNDLIILLGACCIGQGIATGLILPKITSPQKNDGTRWYLMQKDPNYAMDQALILSISADYSRKGDYSGLNLKNVRSLQKSLNRENAYLGYWFECEHLSSIGEKEAVEDITLTMKNLEQDLSKTFIKMFNNQ